MVGVTAPTGGPVLDAPSAPAPAPSPTRRSKVWPTLVVVASYLACAVVGFSHVWSHPTSQLVGIGASDPARMIWFLAWFPFALGHLLNPFVTTWANAPYGVNVLGDTSQPLLGVLASPVTVLFGPIASFNVLMTLAFATSATAGYTLARPRHLLASGGVRLRPPLRFSPYMVARGPSVTSTSCSSPCHRSSSSPSTTSWCASPDDRSGWDAGWACWSSPSTSSPARSSPARRSWPSAGWSSSPC